MRVTEPISLGGSCYLCWSEEQIDPTFWRDQEVLFSEPRIGGGWYVYLGDPNFEETDG